MGQPASQSEEKGRARQISSASSAVDGRRESCTEFDEAINYGDGHLLWWSIDLGDLYNIAHVTITRGKLGIILVTVRIVYFHVQLERSNKYGICNKIYFVCTDM